MLLAEAEASEHFIDRFIAHCTFSRRTCFPASKAFLQSPNYQEILSETIPIPYEEIEYMACVRRSNVNDVDMLTRKK